jgi:fatty-acyl-CoA synthase
MSPPSTEFPAAAGSILSGSLLRDEPGLGALSMPGFIREVTARHAAREALMLHDPDGTVRWSYAELWERSFEVAQALLACGTAKHSRVGIMMTNRPEWLAAFFGVGLAGGVAVTISTFSTPSELDYFLQISGVSILLFEAEVAKKNFSDILAELVPGMDTASPGQLADDRVPFLRRLVVVGAASRHDAVEDWPAFLAHGRTVARELVEATAATVQPADPGAVFFSSGSTSRPKGILNSHRAMAIQCWRSARTYALRDDVRCWTANGFMWSGNFVMALGGTLAAGGALILQRLFEPAAALALMQVERATFPVAWPHQWAQLEAAPSWLTTDLTALHYVGSTGAAARHPCVATQWAEPVWAYGNTETFTISVSFPSGTPLDVAQGSHGIPLPGNTLKIVDPATGAIVPRGQRGEIGIKGPTLMMGYLGIPLDATLDADGFLLTGDGGYIDAQERLIWEGRLSDVIKTGGANVSPLEVDAVLQTHPQVKVAQTIGVPHDTLGEMVVSCIVLHEGAMIDETAVRAFLKQSLASYKVPRRVVFLAEQNLSLTASAKIKSAALRELIAPRLR